MSSANRSDDGRRSASHSVAIEAVPRRWWQRATMARRPESRATKAISSDWISAAAQTVRA